MSMNALEWFRAGRPYRSKLGGGDPLKADPRFYTRAERYFAAQPPGGCLCDAVAEHQLPAEALADWLARCPGCASQVKRTAGLQYSDKLGGFVGPGMSAPDARTLRPLQMETLPPPQIATDPRGSVGDTPMGKLNFAPTSTGTSSGGSSTSGGWVDTGLNIGNQVVGSGIGASKCKGPYNYVNGRCVLKPPTWGGWANYPGGYAGFVSTVGGANVGYQGSGNAGLGLGPGGPCPTGFEWDGMQCIQSGFQGWVEQTLPGGETGTGLDVYGQAVMGAFGKPAIVPATMSQPTRRCPPGTVLGKDNLCYARGSIANSNRKWPKPPRPLLSSHDMKTIRKAKSLANRVKKAATATGFSCRKR